MVDVRAARPEELPEVSALVGTTFASDAMLMWTFPGATDPTAGTERFFGAFHRAALPEGWIWVVGDGRIDGMAMWVPPDPDGRYETVMRRFDDDVSQITSERRERYDGFWAWIDEHRPAAPHWYLEHIAVAPALRGSGLGRALIEHGLTRADADRAPAWLVTSKPQNVPLYERFGFEVDAAEDAPEGGPYLWFMQRAPR
jgi:GNAT superfamily N-acetyltransferase